MKIFGFQIGRAKAAVEPMNYANSNGAFGRGGWFNIVREGFPGAFQANIAVDSPQSILSYSAVYSCVTLIASDIAKLCLSLVTEDENGICTPAPPNSPFWPVLRKPNRYQNRIKFIEQWVLSKLLYGNAYVLKERDGRNMVVAMYVLDPQRVTPLVTAQGDVYYKLKVDQLAGIELEITVPASEVIHDRMNCLWHPLVGVSPIYACGMSATMGNKIQANSATFFHNMSRPSGMLTAPGTIDGETAQRLKGEFESNFGGSKLGRLFVAGDGLSYNAMTINAVDAQLVAQLDWTAVDVARAFHMPLFKIGAESGRNTGNLTIDAQQQQYLNDCLHIHIEDIELCLTEGLEMAGKYEVDIDEDGLLRMDKGALAESLKNLSGIMKVDEQRQKLRLPKVPGGDSPYLQQQNYSLSALAKRDASDDPFATAKPPVASPAALPDPNGDKEAQALTTALIERFKSAELVLDASA